MGFRQDSLDRQWRNALDDLRTIDADFPPDPRRDAALRQLQLLIAAQRYEAATILANVIMSMLPHYAPPQAAPITRWLQALAWLTLTIALLVGLALAAR